MEKMSLAARVRALVPSLDPDCGDPHCEDCAPHREAEAIAAELERIAGEMRSDGEKDYGDGADRVPGCALVAWAAALADPKEGA